MLIKLDYTLKSYQDRIRAVELILNNATPKELERMNMDVLGMYLLMCDEEKEYRKKGKFKLRIYTNRKLFEKSIKLSELNPELYVFVNERSWKIEKKQNITNEDKQKEVLKDYWNYLCIAREEKENEKTEYTKRKKIDYILKDLVFDMKVTKDLLNRTIYFKHIGDESTEYDTGTLVDYNNVNHIMACLKVNSRNLSTWVGCISYDIFNILKKLGLTERQKEILNLWRVDGSTTISVGEELGIHNTAVLRHLQAVSKKIQKKIERTK